MDVDLRYETKIRIVKLKESHERGNNLKGL